MGEEPMRASDIQNFNNNRADIIDKLQSVCDMLNLSYEYTEKEFVIKLPHQEEIPVVPPSKRRKSFDTSTWGEQGVDETLPDELPPAEYNLEEGEAPKEPEE
jgi:hypothetical protein